MQIRERGRVVRRYELLGGLGREARGLDRGGRGWGEEFCRGGLFGDGGGCRGCRGDVLGREGGGVRKGHADEGI